MLVFAASDKGGTGRSVTACDAQLTKLAEGIANPGTRDAFETLARCIGDGGSWEAP